MLKDPAAIQLPNHLFLDKYGSWWHESVKFTNHKLSDLFHRSIFYDTTTHKFRIKIGQQVADFNYEDVVFYVMRIHTASNPWQIELNTQQVYKFKPQLLWLGKEQQIYVDLEDDNRARFTRAAHQHLLEYAIDDAHFSIDSITIPLVPLHR